MILGSSEILPSGQNILKSASYFDNSKQQALSLSVAAQKAITKQTRIVIIPPQNDAPILR